MKNDELKEIIREQLKPVFDSLVDNMCILCDTFNTKFPEGTDAEYKKELITNIIKGSCSQMQASLEMMNVKDMEEKIKEAMSGK